MEHVSTRCSICPDAYALHPAVLLSTPSHSSSIVWPSVQLQWLSFSLYPHLVYILGEHRSHMGLPQRTHVTSDLLRSYKLCSIQSRMWDIPPWYLQLPTIKRFIVWSLRDDTKQKSNASICFAGVQLFMEIVIYWVFAPISLFTVLIPFGIC